MSNNSFKKEEARYHNRLYEAQKYREKHNLYPGAPVPAWVYMEPEQRAEILATEIKGVQLRDSIVGDQNDQSGQA